MSLGLQHISRLENIYVVELDELFEVDFVVGLSLGEGLEGLGVAAGGEGVLLFGERLVRFGLVFL